MTRCGILLPTFDPLRTGEVPPVVAAARLAEELGFDAVWAGDHLACPAPVLDAPSCLAAAAAVTERIGLGLQRDAAGPAPGGLGGQAAGDDRRAVAAAGCCWASASAASSPRSSPPPASPSTSAAPGSTRRSHVLPDLLAGRPVEHGGRTLQLTVPPLEPAMAAPPPIYVGGRGEPALKRAARYGDVWLPMWLEPDVLAERSARLAELAAEQGRPRPGLALLVGVHVDDDVERGRREAEAHLRGPVPAAAEGGRALDAGGQRRVGSPSSSRPTWRPASRSCC